MIPFLQRGAVVVGAWMTNSQFLDGIALSGILPAPLIIFSTFVGYFGGGPCGALAMTFGIFLPAFAFTLLGHDYLDRVIANPSIHTFLDGVTAEVPGLIAATTLDLFRQGITSLPAAVILHWRWRPSICGKRRRRLRGPDWRRSARVGALSLAAVCRLSKRAARQPTV